MEGRMSLLLAALVASGMGLAGCIEAIETFSERGGITALEDRDLADNAAAAWNPDAFLVGVFSAETQSEEAQIPADVTVGDGRAPLWYYAYALPDGAGHRVFAVTVDGRVSVVNESMAEHFDYDLDGEDASPVVDWRIDSDAAVGTARGDERFERAAAAANATILEALVTPLDDEITVWHLVVFSDAGLLFAEVDAYNGDLLLVEEIEFDFDVPEFANGYTDWSWSGTMVREPVHIRDEARVDNADGLKEYPFTAFAAQQAYLRLEAWTELPSDGLYWELVDVQSGEAVAEGRLGMFRGGACAAECHYENQWEFEIPEDGEYVLEVGYWRWVGGVPLGGASYALDLTVSDVPMPVAWDDWRGR